MIKRIVTIRKNKDAEYCTTCLTSSDSATIKSLPEITQFGTISLKYCTKENSQFDHIFKPMNTCSSFYLFFVIYLFIFAIPWPFTTYCFRKINVVFLKFVKAFVWLKDKFTLSSDVHIDTTKSDPLEKVGSRTGKIDPYTISPILQRISAYCIPSSSLSMSHLSFEIAALENRARALAEDCATLH